MGSIKFLPNKFDKKYLLLLIPIAIIGFSFWYVIDSVDKANEYLQNASKSNDLVALKFKEKDASGSPDTQQPGSSQTNPSQSSPNQPQQPAQPPNNPNAVVHPSVANCSSGSFTTYFYRTGGTDGYATTGQALPGDDTHKAVYFPDSYLNPPANPVTVTCVKDANGNFVDGWVSTYVFRGDTYLKMEDLSLNPPV